MKRTLLATTLVLLLWGTPALAGPAPPCGTTDTDGDTVPDCADNCSEVANAAQDDTDGDDCGNLCDADYSQDGVIGFADFGQFSVSFNLAGHPLQQHSEPVDAGRVVGFADFGYFASVFNVPNSVGPSGTTAGTAACP
jgi:hypothetical protein